MIRRSTINDKKMDLPVRDIFSLLKHARNEFFDIASLVKGRCYNYSFSHERVFLKYSIVLTTPSCKDTFGFHFSNFFAFEISGFLFLGSSASRGVKTIFDIELVSV